MDWRHIAACREVDPELFFPIGNSGPALLQIEEAKQVCRRCTVLEDCLRWAIDSGQDAGVWGGMSEDERRALKRRTVRLRARAHVLPGSWLVADGQVHDRYGAASRPGRDAQPSAKLAYNQRPHDLKSQARGVLQVEARRQPGSAVAHGHR